jgi:hypothetical protein
MRWAKLSAIAEILSSIAIVVTLIYLAIQTQQNTAALQASSRDSILEADLQHLYRIVDDPDVWFSYRKGNLTDEERVRLFHFLGAFARIRERDWLQYQSGALDEETWKAYQEALLRTLSGINTRKWWAAVSGAGLFDSGFVENVNSGLADRPLEADAATLGVFD